MKLNRYLSYIKDIYIELHDYSFIHSPSQGHQANARFIGRRRLKERIRSLLTKGETRSGAYLITGYRGVGKSSLINQVLDEISPTFFDDRVKNKILRISLATSLIALLWYNKLLPAFLSRYENISVSVSALVIVATFIFTKLLLRTTSNTSTRSTWYIAIFLISAALEFFFIQFVPVIGGRCTFYFTAIITYTLMWVWLIETSRHKNDIKVKDTRNIILFIKNTIHAFDLKNEKYPKFYHYYLIQDIFCVLSPLVWIKPIGDYLRIDLSNPTLGDAIVAHLGALTLYLAISQSLIRITNKISINTFTNFFKETKIYIRETINYSRRINIRINLGQENLNEIEILKLLSKKVQDEYQKVNGIFWGLPFNLSNTLIKLIITYSLVQIILSNETIINANEEFKSAIGITKILPSQQKKLDIDRYFPIYLKYIKSEQEANKSNPYIFNSSQNFKLDSLYKSDLPIVLRSTLAYVDFIIVQVYHRTRHHLQISVVKDFFSKLGSKIQIHHIKLPSILPKDNSYLKFPDVPNYMAIIYFIILWQTLSIITFYTPLQIPSHSKILRRLEDINDRIDAQLDKEHGKDVGNIRTLFRFFSHRKKKYPIASAKEIESELLTILDDIDKIPRILNRPDFIFILDELDKIGRHENRTIQDKENEEAIRPKGAADSAFKNHQESITKLLGNLKHFFTSAKAKFIFIAGREMYDASLADISDRNYFMGSIFHDVIYVNSFLTDECDEVDIKAKSQENHMSYHSTLVEEYVCTFLIPPNWNKYNKSLSLKTYKEYLYDFFYYDELVCIQNLVDHETKDQYKPFFKSTDWENFVNSSSYQLAGRTLYFATKLLQNVTPFSIKELSSIIYHLKLANIRIRIILASKYFNGFSKKKIIKIGKKLQTNVDNVSIARKIQSEKHIAHNADYILFHTRNFITYLTYRSGGAPKKITFLLEQYLTSYDTFAAKINDRLKKCLCIVVGRSSNNSYLHFSYYDLYTFGVIHYLTSPFQYTITRHLRRTDDKLSVSSTYILDHLYKFHDSGFSWRNIEVTPEIVDVNKAPSLRKLINDIIQFLTTIHLDNVVSGLFDFRFNQRLAKEISMLSKVNSRESAAFNFTLDESQEVKRHYKRKLITLQEGYPNHNIKDYYIHSIGFIHGSLGDLHYYDQEYDDAIIQYKDGVQTLRQNPEMDMGRLIVMTRMMLKLCLTFEKKKSFTSALLTYEKLASMVIKHLTIDLKDRNLIISNIKLEQTEFKNSKKTQSILAEVYNNEKVYSVVRHIYKREICLIGESTEDIYANLIQIDLETLRYRNYTKIASASSIRILYQAFIAKFYLKEKEKIGGIKSDDITTIENEINFITRIIGNEDRHLILSEYNNKIGDALFFKNENTLDCKIYYAKAVELLLADKASKHSNVNEIDLQNLLKLTKESNNKTKKLSSDSLKVLANNLSDLGDAILTMQHKVEISDSLFKSLFNNPEEESPTKRVQYTCASLQLCFDYYLLASDIYKETNAYKKAAFQYIKILYIIRQFKGKSTLNRESLDLIKNNIANKAIEYIYFAYSSATQTDLNKIKRILKQERISSIESIQYLPAYAEIQKVVALYGMIQFDTDMLKPEYILSSSRFFNSAIPSLYSRLTVLYFKVRFNDFCYNNLNKIDSDTSINWGDHFIADSIYCFTSIIRILMTSGISYITNHLMLAYAYENRGEWCDRIKEIQNKAEFNETLKDLIGSEAFDTLKPLYNYEKAIQHYHHSVESHQGKTAYANLIDKMFYLDDDYDDEYYHFHAALERAAVVTNQQTSEKIKTKISKLEHLIKGLKKLDSVDIFNASTYLEPK